jgi:hypothetical protein
MGGQGYEVEKSEALMRFYPVASLRQVMAILSGLREVRIVCVSVATHCCRVARVGIGYAFECAQTRLITHGRDSTTRYLFLMMPMRQD